MFNEQYGALLTGAILCYDHTLQYMNNLFCYWITELFHIWKLTAIYSTFRIRNDWEVKSSQAYSVDWKSSIECTNFRDDTFLGINDILLSFIEQNKKCGKKRTYCFWLYIHVNQLDPLLPFFPVHVCSLLCCKKINYKWIHHVHQTGHLLRSLPFFVLRKSEMTGIKPFLITIHWSFTFGFCFRRTYMLLMVLFNDDTGENFLFFRFLRKMN